MPGIHNCLSSLIHPDMLPEEVHIGSEFKSEKFYRFCLKWVAPSPHSFTNRSLNTLLIKLILLIHILNEFLDIRFAIK